MCGRNEPMNRSERTGSSPGRGHLVPTTEPMVSQLAQRQEGSMKRFGSSFLTALGMLVILNGNVLARDICLKDNFGSTYVFRNVARLRPGGAIFLAGVSFLNTSANPFDGSAILNAAGTETRVGIF